LFVLSFKLTIAKRQKNKHAELKQSIDLTLENSDSDDESDKSVFFRRIHKRPHPPAPLPDIQLILMYVVNGKPSEVNTRSSIKMDGTVSQYRNDRAVSVDGIDGTV
jgi:hypothetical protein